jgi:heme oxygenase
VTADSSRESTLLAALRFGTAALHREVEALPSMVRLLGPLGLEDYVGILQRLWRFHAASEASLAHDELPQRFRHRPNLELLERDLRGMAPREPMRRRRASRAESLGMLYVLEGSALGGAVIARRVARSPALAGRTQFFCRPPQEVAERWRAFCALLGAHDAHPQTFRCEALAGAERAFREAKLALGDD